MANFLFSDGAGVPSRFDFTNLDTVVVTHGLGYIPVVWVVVNGQRVYGDVTYNNTLTFTVIFETTETGVIYYR